MRLLTLALTLALGIAGLIAAGNPASASATSPTPPPPAALQADYVLVEKGARRLTLWRDREVIRQYEVRLGLNPIGHKERQGDKRTPEGLYTINGRNPDSRFHLSLGISYPERWDVMMAQHRGLDPGGAIVIHGLPDGVDPARALSIHRAGDWTDGCIALTNPEIEELWSLVPDGTPIEILP